MATTLVGGASVEITLDLTKFATQARTNLTKALSSTQMRDAITQGLDAASAAATESGTLAASRFSEGLSGDTGLLTEAGARAGQATADGLTAGVTAATDTAAAAGQTLGDAVAAGADMSATSLAEAGARGGSEFADAVTASASGVDLTGDAEIAGAEAAVSYGVAGDEAGTAYSDAASTAIDAGAGDVADAADNQASSIDAGASDALAEAGASAGDSFLDGSMESVGKLATKVSPLATAEAAKIGTEAGAEMSAGGLAAGEKLGGGMLDGIKGMASSLGPAIGAIGIGELVKSSLEAGDQLEGANIKIDNLFGKSADSVKAWATQVSGSLRMSGVQADTAAGAFGGYLNGLGLTQAQSASTSEQLVKLSANMAAFNNTDPATMEAAITSALRGRSTALKAYGVTLTTAQINQEALTHANELGLTVTNGTIPALNTQQKALATMYAVMDATKNQQGALASTADTLKAKEQVATAEFANMRAELGTMLMPILAKVFGFLTNDAVPALMATAKWIGQNKEWIEPLAIALGTAVVAWKALTLAQTLGKKAVEEYKAVTQALGSLFGTQAAKAREGAAANLLYNNAIKEGKTETEAATIAQDGLDTSMDANPIMIIVVAIAALAAGFIYAYKHSKTFRDIVNDIGSALKKVWTDVLQPVVNFFMNNWKTALEIAVIALAPFLAGPVLIYRYWGQITSFFSGLWDDIKSMFSTAINAVVDVVKHWYPLILGILSGGILLVPALIFKYWSQISGFITTAWNTALTFLQSIPGKILDIFSGAVGWLKKEGSDIIGGLIDGVSGMAQALWSYLSHVPTQIIEFFAGAINWLEGAGEDIIKGLVRGITNMAGAVGGAIKHAVGDIPGASAVLGAIGVPGFAAGGLVTKPTFAMIGEAGPELVIPVSQLGVPGSPAVQALTSVTGGGAAASAASSGVGGTDPALISAIMALANRPINLQVDKRQLARAVANGNLALARAS